MWTVYDRLIACTRGHDAVDSVMQGENWTMVRTRSGRTGVAATNPARSGRPVDPVWRDEVEHVSHRRYSTGFFYGQPGQYYQNSRYIRDWQVCAIVTDCDKNGLATLSLRNKFSAGDRIEIVGPDLRPFELTVPVMRDMEGGRLEQPRNPQMVFQMQLPKQIPALSILRRAVELSPED